MRGTPLIHYDRNSAGTEAYRAAAVAYLAAGQSVHDPSDIGESLNPLLKAS